MIQRTTHRPSIEKLKHYHDVDDFYCGQNNLNRYIKRYALTNQKAETARTYVGTVNEKVIGYYTLVVSEVIHEDAAERLKKGLSHHPVPVMLLARLATDTTCKGAGAGLLRDAMQRTLQVADIAGIRAFIVHAKNDQAKSFYQHFDFSPSPTDPYHLYLLVKDIQKAINLQ